MDTLKGQTALVTGSSSGIGRAIALLFAREGARVAVTYHAGEERAREVIEAIRSEGGTALAYRVDVADEEEVGELFRQVDRDWGDVDILVNNAGINGSNTPVEQMTTAQWDRVIRTDLYGPFFCCRAFLGLKRRYGTWKGSRIINVSSIHQWVNVPRNADYNAAKAALRNLAYTLALEVADREMTVNNIAPGMILTPINERVISDPELLKRAENIIPFHRGGTAEEVAAVALFLASEASSYVTGSTCKVDGALSILGPDA